MGIWMERRLCTSLSARAVSLETQGLREGGGGGWLTAVDERRDHDGDFRTGPYLLLPGNDRVVNIAVGITVRHRVHIVAGVIFEDSVGLELPGSAVVQDSGPGVVDVDCLLAFVGALLHAFENCECAGDVVCRGRVDHDVGDCCSGCDEVEVFEASYYGGGSHCFDLRCVFLASGQGGDVVAGFEQDLNDVQADKACAD